MHFIKTHFYCFNCSHETAIFFETIPSIEEVSEKVECSSCGELKYCNAGDLGYRSDWPDADYKSWQLQVIKLPYDKYVCNDCLTNYPEPPSFKDVVAVCTKCELESMKLLSCEEVEKNELLQVIEELQNNNK